jgi:phosphatidylserine decarboxylase
VGLNDLVEVANKPNKTNFKFEEVFECDPSAKYYGFKSWDGKPKASPP